MSRRLGNHRARPQLSSYTYGKRAMEELDKKIALARTRKDTAAVEKLEQEKHWAFVNSMPR